jgi:hypothetical protein
MSHPVHGRLVNDSHSGDIPISNKQKRLCSATQASLAHVTACLFRSAGARHSLQNGGLTLGEQEAIYGWQTQRRAAMYAAPEIVGTCLTCITPASFGATLALIAIGVLFAVHTERRTLAAVKTRPTAKSR